MEIQLQHTQRQYSKGVIPNMQLPSDEICKKLKYLILESIASYLSCNMDQARLFIQKFRTNEANHLSDLTLPDHKFCVAYYTFINELLGLKKMKYNPKSETIFHIGESHCLSFAYEQVKIGKNFYTVKPLITFGAKAFHFATKRNNKFKAITKLNFESIPKGSKVFLSFGEIDCRVDEGFIVASQKKDRKLKKIISNTVEGYIGWFLKLNEFTQHSLFFFNIPAPVFDINYSDQQNKYLSKIIREYNFQLKKLLSKYKLNLIDVFKKTNDSEGFSKGSYHIDNRHLSPIFLSEIQNQIISFERGS